MTDLTMTDDGDGTYTVTADRPRRRRAMPVNIDDGGRAAAGYQGSTGDCVVRAFAIVSTVDYETVYRTILERQDEHLRTSRRAYARRIRSAGTIGRHKSPRQGVFNDVWRQLAADLRWEWVPTMSIGSGTTVHLAEGELPEDDPSSGEPARLIARCSKHSVAVIGGVVHDTFDPTRDGTRAVYGYHVGRRMSVDEWNRAVGR